MRGELTHTGAEGVTVHTYTAPYDGWTVNSHIVGLADQLIVIDAQYMMTFAAEVVAFAATLRKPITRLYITHFHPGHLAWSGGFQGADLCAPGGDGQDPGHRRPDRARRARQAQLGHP